MARHLARRGGVWWARLSVPKRLRDAMGRREFIQSCRTPDLQVAKLVAAVLIAEWRRSLMRLECHTMTPNVSKLLAPAPELSIGATVTLAEAEKVGLDRAQLLRVVSGGRVPLYYRVSGVEGYVVAADDLYYDPVTGGRDIPTVKSMPHGAFESTQSAVLQLTDSASIANVILVDATPTIELVAFVVSYQPEKWFIPNATVIASVEALEVSSNAVALIRGHMVAHIPERERQQLSALPQIELASKQAQGAKADVLFSRAVEVYCSDPSGLPNVLESTAEQRQRKKSMLYFAEYMGDLPIGEITSDLLRQFRDGPLRTFPANANHLPKKLARATMKETIQAIKDSAEVRPVLSQASQAERMAYLFNLFSWLHKKEWLARNPAASLKGESGLSKAERRTADQRIRSKSQDDDEEGRQPFTPEELVSIFAQPQYQTGDGRHITKGNQSWAPFEYWLPLLGLYAGCRIGEVSQLHLNDVREIDGVWALDINDYTKDKRVKTKETSIRRIPLHPKLIELGFLEYCDLLRGAGFQRVFPELTYSTSDARYAKEPIRKMSAMLESLGMPRNGEKVFHCLRHNANNALIRVPMSALPYADVNLRQYIRYKLMGHALAEGDVNQAHYTKTTMTEMLSLVSGVDHELPEVTKFNASAGLDAVRAALNRKQGYRRGAEDMGPFELKS